MKHITTLMAAGAVVLAAGVAQADTISYDATSFSKDGHSIWLANGAGDLGQKFNFDPSGTFHTDGKDQAQLFGNVFAASDATNGFQVDFRYDGDVADRTGFKNGGLGNSAAPGDPEVLDPSIFFHNLVGGQLRGFGGILAGVLLEVTRAPEDGSLATQVGNGANDKNGNFGMSNWFSVTCVAGCSPDLSIWGAGDVNLNLDNPNGNVTPVPVPAAGWLLLAGLGGLAAMKRRKAA